MKKSLRNALIAAFVLSAASAAMAHEAEIPKSGGLREVILADGREILADANELTVYTFDIDRVDESNCYDRCAKAWPPVLLNAKQEVAAPFGTTTRKDGTVQLTYDHKPLYLFQGDKAEGDITGDGLNDVWHIVVLEE